MDTIQIQWTGDKVTHMENDWEKWFPTLIKKDGGRGERAVEGGQIMHLNWGEIDSYWNRQLKIKLNFENEYS